MKLARSLYAKIFVWFWITLSAGSLLIVAFTITTGTQPLGRRWMRLTQDMYAHTAVDFYISGGPPALSRYLATLRDSSGLHAALLDDRQHDVLNGPPVPGTERVLERAVSSGASNFHLGRLWTAATPVQYQGRQFYFVMQVRPFSGFFAGQGLWRPMLLRLILVLAIAGIFCFLLARHIMAPVRALQMAALRMAGGDLASRAYPSIAPRHDELADTARAFDQMADRIQQLVQKRQELLADISHELRSPLTRLTVSLELLRRGESDVFDKMESDLEKMNEMIGQVLLLTRLDLEPSRASFTEVDLAAMLSSIAQDAEFEVQAEEKHVTVALAGPCRVLGDTNLLRSCIENIVRNAAHYTAPSTVVEVAVRRFVSAHGHAQYEIKVRDRGPGVPPEALPRLFDAFYRVSESRDLREGGTGLGLSIAQKVAELHNGSIAAANRVDGPGLEIQLLLPAIQS